MTDPLTVPARDGIEAQNGLNDIFPGDPYPVRDQLKRGLDALRAKASRGKITSAEVFNLTDPLMDILSRCEAQPEAQAVPEGWKLVPIEPTEAMCVAGCREDDILGELVDWRGPDTTTREVVANLYRAMLAASPATGGA